MEILEDGGRIMRSVPVSGPHSMHNTFNKKIKTVKSKMVHESFQEWKGERFADFRI